jgi:pimeloyl-ACP methyl ester carboxylesterase
LGGERHPQSRHKSTEAEGVNVMPGPQGLLSQLAPVEPRHWVGVVKNKPHQASSGVISGGPYQLAIVEFDDQGRCYDRRQMDAVQSRLSSYTTDAIILTFVHGWKHDARTDDENLTTFLQVLGETARYESGQNTPPRPVLGVFVAWRGMSLYDRLGWSENVTFWDRQDAGRRVASGSVRELFGRLRRYRDTRRSLGGSPALMIVGHSFGGMIVYAALAQSLIEAAATPAGAITPRFADLVLLVNPAIEGARYLPVHDLVKSGANQNQAQGILQPPVFVCATARNDWATGLAFPFGNSWSLLLESYLGREERQAMIHTIGHLPWMTTHLLSGGASAGDYSLKRRPNVPAARGLFWVVRAEPAVINGHNGISKEPFLHFVADLVFSHVAHSQGKAGPTSGLGLH